MVEVTGMKTVLAVWACNIIGSIFASVIGAWLGYQEPKLNLWAMQMGHWSAIIYLAFKISDLKRMERQ